MDDPPPPRAIAPLCVMGTIAFAVATAYWLLSGDHFFTTLNAFWTLVLLLVTFLVYRRPNLEKDLVRSFAGRAYHRVRPVLFLLGPLVALGYALTASFWWRHHSYYLALINAAWAICFAVSGILISLRGLRCALSIVCLSAGGLYLVTATWWFAEGRELEPTRNTRFFCYNLLWCAVLVAAGLIIDRSRPVTRK